MRRNTITWIAVAAVTMLTLAGCGSNRDTSGSATSGGTDLGSDPVTGIAYVGADVCIGCHEGFSWSAGAVESFLQSTHVIHSDHIEATSEELCLSCHDPIGDGRTLESLIDPANVPADGLAAVTCETCHGAGGEHYGVGPIPAATPDYNACGQCHNNRWTTEMPSHITYHPEGNNIVEDYVAGGHFANEDSHNSNVCSKCHTDEGARLYKGVDTVAGLETVVLAVPSPSHPVQCRTCHDSHNPGELLEAANSSATAEYRTCTNCHQAHDANVGTTKYTLAGSTSTDGASADGDLIYHATRWNRIITTTHYDNPATTDKIEGYAMSKKNERACRDCHNVHAADVSINEAWAESAHGGHILEAKLDAVTGARTIDEVIAIKAAGANDVAGTPGFAAAWVHYDWDDSSRQSCQRCHTATGSKNFLTDPVNYNPAKNDFSHLVGWTGTQAADGTFSAITSSGQNEMLYCWACHTNNSGALRDPGAITEIYEGTVAAPLVEVSYPDISGSNICMSCHLGRETGEVVKTKTGFTNLSFVNSHYLSAGGQLFGTTGYEYTGLNYNNVTFFAHDQIGTATEPGTGENGPCVACHMTSPDSHRFLPVTKDETTGEVTAVTAAVCANCHTAISAAEMNNWEMGYEASLDILMLALESKGIYFYNAHPYFYTAPYNPAYTEAGACTDNLPVKNWQTGGTSTFTWSGTSCTSAVDVAGTADTGADNMGAAFNLNLLLHDPGGFAHNKYYVKALIWDSIDYIYNGVLGDGDVPAAIAALAPDAATQSAALNYLGTTRPGTGIRLP